MAKQAKSGTKRKTSDSKAADKGKKDNTPLRAPIPYHLRNKQTPK